MSLLLLALALFGAFALGAGTMFLVLEFKNAPIVDEPWDAGDSAPPTPAEMARLQAGIAAPAKGLKLIKWKGMK